MHPHFAISTSLPLSLPHTLPLPPGQQRPPHQNAQHPRAPLQRPERAGGSAMWMLLVSFSRMYVIDGCGKPNPIALHSPGESPSSPSSATVAITTTLLYDQISLIKVNNNSPMDPRRTSTPPSSPSSARPSPPPTSLSSSPTRHAPSPGAPSSSSYSAPT